MKTLQALATRIEALPGFTTASFRTTADAQTALEALTAESIPARLVTTLTGTLEVRF